MNGAAGVRVMHPSKSKIAGSLLLPCLSGRPPPFPPGWTLHSGVAPRVQAEQSSSSGPKLQSPLNRRGKKENT